MRLLIVDDEEASRELCRDFLEADGYTLLVAEGGERALQLLEESPCHLVITDLNMPQMTGLELLRTIKQRYPTTEVILITAYGEIKTAVEAMRDGAFDYITKPFSKDLFRFTVQRCLEKQRLVEQLKAVQEELAQKEKLALIGALAAGVAHRLRNPLNIILMCAQYLKGHFPPGDERQEVTIAIEEKVKVLERTARSLIEYSRSSHPMPAPTDLHQLLEVVVHGIAARCKIQRVAVERQYAKQLPPLPLDRELIEEAFTNIIDNALDVMGDHGTLTISTARDPSEARIEFTNTGAALPPELREKIFEPFFTTKDGGVGLGLTIAKRIIEEHRGAILVASFPKRHTTTVSVHLPLTNKWGQTPNAG